MQFKRYIVNTIDQNKLRAIFGADHEFSIVKQSKMSNKTIVSIRIEQRVNVDYANELNVDITPTNKYYF